MSSTITFVRPQALFLSLLILGACLPSAARDAPNGQTRSAPGPGPVPAAPLEPNIGAGVFVPNLNAITAPVPIPAGAYDRPERLYVLPVVIAPRGQGRWLPDRNAPGMNLNGQPFAGSPYLGAETFKTQYERVENNLSVHLQTARLMYKNRMRNPLNGDPRGTFELADWDAQSGKARKVVSQYQSIDPLIMELANYDLTDVVALHGVQPLPTPHWVGEIFDKIGCERMSCPFVLAIVMVGNPFNPVHGAKWNYGFNNGGGAAYFNYSTALASWNPDTTAATHNFLSTLVHELGHAFGMPHSDDYCNVVTDCGNYPRFDINNSDSIMSYNLDNQIFGCPRASAADSTHCLLPHSRTISLLPGKLEREDLRLLDANALAFPDLDYQPALDHPQPLDPVYQLDAGGDWEVTTTNRLLVSSPDTHPQSVRPAVLIGGYSESILEIQEPDFLRTWVSSQGTFGSWASYNIYLPQPVTLKRLRVYGGHDGDNDRPTGLQLFVAGDSNLIASGYNLFGANHDLTTNRTGSHFVLQVQRGASGLARLRGLRFFGTVAGSNQTREFFAPAEPVATTAFGSTFGGSIDNIVGSDQLIPSSSLPFQPQASWHSSARTPGSWVSVDVAFPRETKLHGISVNSGHTNGVHAARQIQIERECVCRHPYNGSGGVCGSSSIAQCTAAGGIGERVYEVVVWESNAMQDDYVPFSDTTARRWRIALKTATGPQGSQSWSVIRGLRFWTGTTAGSYELFPPRDSIQ